VFCWHGENMLDKESIQLHNLKITDLGQGFREPFTNVTDESFTRETNLSLIPAHKKV
jgi:hypothetical protein